MKILGCFLVVLFVISAIPAQAADLTIFGGFQHQGKITFGNAAGAAGTGLGDLIFHSDNFGVFGGRVGLGLFGIPFLSQEHTLAVAPSFIDTHSKAVIYNSNLMLQAPLILVKPYATIGLGLIDASDKNTSPGAPPSAIGTHFAVNYGGGLKFSLFGPVGGRLDVRDYTIPKVQSPLGGSSQTLNVLEVSAGVIFSF